MPRPSACVSAIGPQGPSLRSGVAETRGTRAPGRFVAASSSGLIPRHRYQAARKWIHRHEGEDGQSAPPGLLGADTGALPSSSAADAQEAFDAYGKSTPLPALPRLPLPPGYVPPPVSMGTGGSRHGTLNTLRRRGDNRQGAAAPGDPGVKSPYQGDGHQRTGTEGTKGAVEGRTTIPPAPQRRTE